MSVLPLLQIFGKCRNVFSVNTHPVQFKILLRCHSLQTGVSTGYCMYFFFIFLIQIAAFGLQFCNNGKFLSTALTRNCSTCCILFYVIFAFMLFCSWLYWSMFCPFKCSCRTHQQFQKWNLCDLTVTSSNVLHMEVKIEGEVTGICNIFVQISQ